MVKVSDHLYVSELDCHDGTPYPEEWLETRGKVLGAEFEVIRQLCGNCTITVDSAYRSPDYNFRIHGSPRSQHLLGTALDLACPRWMTPSQFFLRCLRAALRPGSRIRGLGFYPTSRFVHIDCRDAETLALWDEADVE